MLRLIPLFLSMACLTHADFAPINPAPISSFEGLDQLTNKENLPRSVSFNCSICHPIPSPKSLPSSLWPIQLQSMKGIMETHKLHVSDHDLKIWMDHYVLNSPEKLEELSYFKPSTPQSWKFQPIGDPPKVDLRKAPSPQNRPPIITGVQKIDLFKTGQQGLLVCDGNRNQLTFLDFSKGVRVEKVLASLPVPVKTVVYDHNGDGLLDISVACIGKLEKPDDSPVGSAYVLIQNKKKSFKVHRLIDGHPRIADAQPADVDGDGDLDHLLAIYGWRYSGQLAWMENQGKNKLELHTITSLNGCSDIIPMDLNGDKHQDFVALFSQQHELIIAYTSRGDGSFKEEKLFQARNPSFGSTRLKAVDLDQDGDKDLIFINGDGLDASGPKPYHGVQWLERSKKGNFIYHHITSFYGVYDIDWGDLDGDGDLDLVASSQFNRWDDPKRFSLIWLENDGQQNFSPHGIAHRPSHLGTVCVVDVDLDGRPDIVAGGMHIIPPFKKSNLGRLSLWLNRQPQAKK
jgi:hypothetical protein